MINGHDIPRVMRRFPRHKQGRALRTFSSPTSLVCYENTQNLIMWIGLGFSKSTVLGRAVSWARFFFFPSLRVFPGFFPSLRVFPGFFPVPTSVRSFARFHPAPFRLQTFMTSCVPATCPLMSLYKPNLTAIDYLSRFSWQKVPMTIWAGNDVYCEG